MIATPGSAYVDVTPGFITFWDGGIAGAPAGRLVGEAPGDGAGYTFVTGGDVTGDAVADLVVAAPRSSAAATGGWRGVCDRRRAVMQIQEGKLDR
jgi:hypothetical protein